ncbi:MAG: FG-GAP-like repeat-containing protein [Candidatus Polarisedimenticolia bacterium]
MAPSRLLRPVRLLAVAALLVGTAAWGQGGQTGKTSKSKSSPAAKPAAASQPSKADEILRFNNLGIAYLAQYKPAEAQKQFEQALKLDPSYVVAQVNLGVAALAQVHYDEAIASFHKALALDPNNIYAHFNLSMIHRLQGKPAEALESGRKALDLDPRDPDIHYHVGSVYMAQREFDKAIQEFETTLRLDPNFLSAYYSLGRAYISKGDMEKGKTFIERHRELMAGAGATPAVGLKYGEQGKYSYAMEDTGTGDAAAPLEKGRVTFVDVTPGSGVSFRHAGSADLDIFKKPPRGESALRREVPGALGSGVAVGDVDGDGLEDLFFANAGGDPAPVSELYMNRGALRFEKAAAGAPAVKGHALSAAFGDLDGDKDLDLVVVLSDRVMAFANDGKGAFQDVSEAAGISSATVKGMPGGVSLADVDHDGDLDIFVAGFLGSIPASAAAAFPQGWPGGNSLLFLNAGAPEGEGAAPRLLFKEAGAATKLQRAGRRVTGGVFGDFDNDRDIDVATASPADGSTVLSNLRDGTFGDLGDAAGLPAPAPLVGITSGDYNKDGWMDLAATALDGGPPRLFRNMLGRIPGNIKGAGMFALDVTAMAGITSDISVPRFGVALADMDNDGYLDLLSVNGSTEGPALLLHRNDGAGSFTPVNELTGLDTVMARGGRGLATADLDRDGDLDVVISNAGNHPTLLRNDGGNAGHWIRVSPEGLHSNRPGVGTKVEVKSGRLWQKAEVVAGSGYLSQSSLQFHLGLGQRERVDSVRLLWPGGVLQDEVQVKADAVLAVQELDRKGSSCPILYAWNGKEMSFVSDFLGGAALGYRTGPAGFNYPDTDEYVRIAASQLVPKDGRLSLRMVNQLEETLFFDQARLLAVDHPDGTEMYPDEKLLPGPPFQPFRVFVVSGARPPVAAHDQSGRDVLSAVSKLDRVYAGPPDVDPSSSRTFRGYAPEHHITLDLGEVPSDGPVVLLLHGWIDYADSTSNVAAAQAGMKLTPPWLEEISEASGTRSTRVMPSIGFPGGLPKTMTVDLTGKLSPGVHSVRIGTSMRIFWDRILVATHVAASPPTITAVDASSAVLRNRGFPALALPDGRRPEQYDYQKDEPSIHWKSHVGAYTRYGDVAPLLSKVDDRYVITRGGDEIALEFDAAAFPPLAAGWTRTWLLQTDGFGKDMDVNSARPDTVGPLPWHAMSAYPPPAREVSPFETEPLMTWQDEYNTRRVPAPLAPLTPPSKR